MVLLLRVMTLKMSLGRIDLSEPWGHGLYKLYLPGLSSTEQIPRNFSPNNFPSSIFPISFVPFQFFLRSYRELGLRRRDRLVSTLLLTGRCNGNLRMMIKQLKRRETANCKIPPDFQLFLRPESRKEASKLPSGLKASVRTTGI